MSNFFSKSGMYRLCLMPFILFCSVFASENTFSRPWQNNMDVIHKQIDGYITFIFLYYDYDLSSQVNSYLSFCSLKYIDDDNTYTSLIQTKTEKQDIKGVMWMKIENIKRNGIIEFPSMQKRSSLISKFVGEKLSDAQYQYGENKIKSRNATMAIKWTLPKSIKPVKSIQFEGTWTVYDKNAKSTVNKNIFKIFRLDKKKSSSNRLQNAPSELNSEIGNEVTVTGKTDAINVTGAEPGEQIMVYTVSGEEVKSVVANDDVVNIKLPTNQIYIVKAGQARYKVVL